MTLSDAIIFMVYVAIIIWALIGIVVLFERVPFLRRLIDWLIEQTRLDARDDGKKQH